MTNFKGTKGKWVVQNTGLLDKFETKIVCGQIRIAEAKHYNHGESDWSVNDPIPSEGKANALLISKAPEMLELLEECVETALIAGDMELHNKIKNLIEEATTL